MSRVTVEDCLDKINGYFKLAHLASKRAVELSNGKEALIDTSTKSSTKKEKPTIIALREIASGKITEEYFEKVDLNEDYLDLNVADWIKEVQEKNEKLKNNDF